MAKGRPGGISAALQRLGFQIDRFKDRYARDSMLARSITHRSPNNRVMMTHNRFRS